MRRATLLAALISLARIAEAAVPADAAGPVVRPAAPPAAATPATRAPGAASLRPVDFFLPASADRAGSTSVGPQPVSLNESALYALRAGAKVRLQLPNGTFPVVFDSLERYPAGVREWRGHVEGQPESRVRLVVAKDGSSGYIRTGMKNFRIARYDGRNWLSEDRGAARVLRTASNATPVVAIDQTRGRAAVAPPKDLPAAATYPVRLDPVRLSRLPERSETEIDLPNAGTYKVVYESSVANADGTTTWVGYLRDYGDDYRVLLTYGPDGSDGRILTPYGEFLLQGRDGTNWLIDVTRAGLHAPTPTSSDALVPQGVVGGVPPPLTLVAAAPIVKGQPIARSAAVSHARPSTGSAGTAASTSTIDVLVLYTDGFQARLGSSATTRIAQLVAVANQAFQDSGIAVTLRLVAAVQVSYTDVNADTAALDDVTGGVGPFANVNALRAAYGADVVSLIRPFHLDSQLTCGLGWVGGFGGTAIQSASGAAFSVVGDGTDMDGHPYYCVDYTMAHEIGHNLGSMHDRATVATQGGGVGAYPYAFGYGISGTFGTVMSYISPVIGRFSNPAIATCAGQACGVNGDDPVNGADNARSINNTRAAVAAFMPTTVPLTYRISGVVATSNGTPVAGVSVTGPGATCRGSGTNGAYTCSVSPGWSGTLTAVRAGYAFAPAGADYSLVSASLANQNFVATPSP